MKILCKKPSKDQKIKGWKNKIYDIINVNLPKLIKHKKIQNSHWVFQEKIKKKAPNWFSYLTKNFCSLFY
jgi:hypothetical protein